MKRPTEDPVSFFKGLYIGVMLSVIFFWLPLAVALKHYVTNC